MSATPTAMRKLVKGKVKTAKTNPAKAARAKSPQVLGRRLQLHFIYNKKKSTYIYIYWKKNYIYIYCKYIYIYFILLSTKQEALCTFTDMNYKQYTILS